MRLLLVAALAAVTACQIEPNTSSTEQAIIGVIFSPPSGGNLGTVQVGSQSAPYGISINPSGLQDSSFTIDSITGCSDFLVNAPGLPATIYKTCISYSPCFAADFSCVPAANLTCYEWEIVGYDFSAVFKPNVQGPSSCALQVQIGGLGLRTYTVNGDGTLPPIDIDVSPTAVNFGDVRRNTASSDAGVTVRNLGGQTLTVSSATVTGGYTITGGPTGTYAIPVSGAQGYTITCNPTATGPLP
ncbi:MAG: choice-of-anchor D domain-containing protein, partial [Polyangiales bacterium]